MLSYRISEKLVKVEDPAVMGILNLTPDSFYAEGRFMDVDKAVAATRSMVRDGIDILDIGAASSRPGASEVGPVEELRRIEPVLKQIVSEFPDLLISIDTYWRKVAERAVILGASMINDISGGMKGDGLIEFVAEAKIPYVLMHMQGQPTNMQENPVYGNVVQEILQFFIEKIDYLDRKGVVDIIIDPGFGFGKSIEHNYDLLKKLSVFKLVEKQILVGLSRKSMIYKHLKINPEASLPATCALHLRALENGANILRVHDVAEAHQAIKLFKALENYL